MALSSEPGITPEELRLAARNHAMPLEALRWPITPAGLHYLLVHYDIPVVDPDGWHLELRGAVERERSWGLEELYELPAVELTATMECAGNGRALFEPRPLSQPWLTEAVGTATWRGAGLAAILADARPGADAREVVFSGLDRGIEGGIAQRYERSLTLEQALESDAVLAYSMNGEPLPVQHGFPLRLVVPGWYGMTNVKWLSTITVVTEAFDGYQNAVAYRYRREENETGRAVTRMRPRSLLAPPGVPDFFTRERLVEGSPVPLQGRAWSGRAPIARVEVSDDEGDSWIEARLTSDLDGPWAWVRFDLDWRPSRAGSFTLCCRATDETGEAQPLTADWNLGGYENNAVQRLRVVVR